MIKEGIVMKIHDRKVCILTNDGQFLNVKAENKLPTIGEIFKGKVITINYSFYKYAAIAASLFLAIVLITFTSLYLNPVTTVALNINPHIELQANKWNRVIKTVALNTDGQKLLQNISLKNKTIDHSLSLIIEESKNENFINEDYIKSEKTISVEITSKTQVAVDLTEFKNKIEKENIKVLIKSIKTKGSTGDVNIKVNKKDFKELKLPTKSPKPLKKEELPKEKQPKVVTPNKDKNKLKDKEQFNKNIKFNDKTKANKPKSQSSHENKVNHIKVNANKTKPTNPNLKEKAKPTVKTKGKEK